MGTLHNKQWHGLCRVPTSIPRKPTGTAGVTHVARRAGKKPRFLKQKIGFIGYIGFLGFNLQMPDTKLQPTSTMKSKDKSSEQRFGHVNATKTHSYLNIILIELVTQ